MADIKPLGEVSDAFAVLADCGDETGLTPAEIAQFEKYVDGLFWWGVGDPAGFGECAVTGGRAERFTLIGE